MARLTKRYPNGNVTLDEVGFTQNQETIDREIRNFAPALAAIKKLAEFEDAEEKGLLIHLPCKVGDTVWINDDCFGNMCKGGVFNIEFTNNGLKIGVFGWSALMGDEFNIFVNADDFGKTVFLTPEAAKQALKGKSMTGI